VEVNQDTWQADVVERSHGEPVVVDFWADWCGPCHMLAPVLERETASRSLPLAKLDVDANPELAAQYGIRGIPAVKAFRNGRVVGEFTGAVSPAVVGDFLDRLTQPTHAQRLVEELRASGELPEVVAALEQEDYERAFELLLEETAHADERDRREWLRERIVSLFGGLGQEHPLTMRYRRRLATLLF